MSNGDPRKSARWKKARAAAIATKDHVCYLCGHHIDELRGRGPLSVSVDHIIPIKRGGPPFDLENLMLTHRVCNQIKGSKLLGERIEIDSALAVESKLEFESDYMEWLDGEPSE